MVIETICVEISWRRGPRGRSPIEGGRALQAKPVSVHSFANGICFALSRGMNQPCEPTECPRPTSIGGSRTSMQNPTPRVDTGGDDGGLSAFLGARRRLFGIAYRMLQTAAEAEDVVQEVWIRWQSTDRSAIRDPAAFLATTTTRLAINVIQSARSRRETSIEVSLPEPVDAGADPELHAEQSEALKSAVLVLLKTLSPAERPRMFFGKRSTTRIVRSRTFSDSKRPKPARFSRRVRRSCPRGRAPGARVSFRPDRPRLGGNARPGGTGRVDVRATRCRASSWPTLRRCRSVMRDRRCASGRFRRRRPLAQRLDGRTSPALLNLIPLGMRF
jgi:Sigma-70 region 2